MNRAVVFRPGAGSDFLDACAWYEQQRDGLGDRFASSVEVAVETISKSPESFPFVHRDVRRALLRPFPYGLFYRLRDQSIHVPAFVHGRRDPIVWKAKSDDD